MLVLGETFFWLKHKIATIYVDSFRKSTISELPALKTQIKQKLSKNFVLLNENPHQLPSAFLHQNLLT